MTEYIDREKLADALKIWQNSLIEAYGEDDEYVRCLDSVLLGVDNAPAADVRPVVRGKWLYDEGEFACSVCDGVMVRNVFKFCPWCGAEMEGGNG